DAEAILLAAQDTDLLVTVEDHFLTGGLFSIVSELLVRYRVAADVLPLALSERWFQPGLLADVLSYEGFDAGKLADLIMARWHRRN
ncbi:MAG: transketolase, partial [Anaerolineae bacterium]|nr:transketolase [Anaerolineae bacterium]